MCEVAVLLIFFNRPTVLVQTFEQIRKVKPKKLYLAQDGPRENNDSDWDNILKCRAIVENIDWECEVFRKYESENQGCGKGPYFAINWVFEREDSAIILEDDCIASESFFVFCEEMLIRYKNDERIFLITGCNSTLKTKTAGSYFFGDSGTNWGWATWKRNWAMMDYQCSWAKDKTIIKDLKNHLTKRFGARKAKKEINWFLDTYNRLQKGENISYWDVQWQAVRYLNNQLSIIPSCNLITNIGLGEISTHAQKSRIPVKLYDEIGKTHFCYNQRYEIDFPLKHPKYMMKNIDYDKKMDRALYPSFIQRVFRKLKKIVQR